MSTSDKICKDVSLNDDVVCEVTEKLQRISTIDNGVSVCANCGKEGSDVVNTCNKCKRVKYCNSSCKKKHRHKHKKECEEHIRRAAEKHNEELRLTAEHEAKLHDEKLFKQPPPPPAEDCPICFIRLPTRKSGSRYMSCCGKEICCGCVHAPLYDNQGNKVDNRKCPFCRRTPPASDEENVERLKLRIDAGDPDAIYAVGVFYREGVSGIIQDYTKALEHWHRAAELGDAQSYCMIGISYYYGHGVEVDKKKAKHYYELAAIGGDVTARHNLGINEGEAGNAERALRHHMIAVRAGENDSLKEIQELYSDGHATKDDYMKALKLYQQYLGEIRSRQRDEAAAFSEQYRYFGGD